MAKYSTVSNMLIMMPNVMSRTSADSAQLAHFVDMAEGTVDAYLARRYTLPLSETPKIIETLTTQVAIYEFLSKRVFAGEVAAESFWVQSYKEAQRMLRDISNGQMELTNSAGTVLTDASVVWSSQEDYLATHTEDDPLFQQRDPDKIDDIRDDRQLYPTVRLTP